MSESQNENITNAVVNSIGVRLLKMVFGLYFLLTIAITIVQLVAEYRHAKDGVFHDMVDLVETLEDSLTRSLWSYNFEQMSATMIGIEKVSIISGAKIVQPDGTIYASIGVYPTSETVISEKKISSNYGEIREIIYESEGGNRTVYSHSFPIIQTEKNRRLVVGFGYFYMDRSFIITRVEYGFILIIISTILKALVFWFIFLFFTKRIVAKPLAVLTAATQEMNPNNDTFTEITESVEMQALLRSTKNDELTFLARVFVQMRDAVMEKIHVIEEQNCTLERRVADRTKHVEEINTKLKHMSMHDCLTGLPNRLLFENRLSDLISHAERLSQVFALASIDLRKFKEVNDTYGHQAGDFVLTELTSRMLSVISSTDMLARMGGDEFSLLLPNIDRSLIPTIAERIIACCDVPIIYDNVNIMVDLNIGVALYPHHEKESGPLQKCADMAMYLAKSKELGFTFYSPEIGLDFRRKSAIERDFLVALGREEISLCYQPVVSTVDFSVVGLEALMRWDHATLGEITPSEFIPIAEQSNNIKRLTLWLLKTAFKYAHDIFQKGYVTKISINISSRMLSDNEFPELITEIAHQSNIAPSSVQLEITESCVLDSPTHTLFMLGALKEKGFKITVAGFGTGYSALNYLTDIHVDLLKIDRHLLLKFSSSSSLLVKTIIELAHKLGIEIVAEGVENEALVTLLTELNCDYLQGFYFSKPLTTDHVIPWLQSNTSKASLVKKD